MKFSNKLVFHLRSCGGEIKPRLFLFFILESMLDAEETEVVHEPSVTLSRVSRERDVVFVFTYMAFS